MNIDDLHQRYDEAEESLTETIQSSTEAQLVQGGGDDE